MSKINRFAVFSAITAAVMAIPALAEDTIPGGGAAIPGLDITSITAILTTIAGMVGAIGMGSLMIVMGVKSFAYIKSALGKG
jgi:ABC-type methionine transport system permease subunit